MYKLAASLFMPQGWKHVKKVAAYSLEMMVLIKKMLKSDVSLIEETSWFIEVGV